MSEEKKPSKPVRVKPVGNASGSIRVEKSMADVNKKRRNNTPSFSLLSSSIIHLFSSCFRIFITVNYKMKI